MNMIIPLAAHVFMPSTHKKGIIVLLTGSIDLKHSLYLVFVYAGRRMEERNEEGCGRRNQAAFFLCRVCGRIASRLCRPQNLVPGMI